MEHNISARGMAILVLVTCSLGFLVLLFLILFYGTWLLLAGQIAFVLAGLRWGVLPVVNQGVDLVEKIQRVQLQRQHALLTINADKDGYYPQLYDIEARRPVYYPNEFPAAQVRAMLDAPTIIDQEPEEEEEEEPAAEPARKYNLSDLIEAGQMEPETPRNPETLIGFSRSEDGEVQEVRGPLLHPDESIYDSVFVAGDTGTGKSAFGTLNAAITVRNGGYIFCIDPDARFKQSMNVRLGVLKQFLLCEVAETPDQARKVIQLARQELDYPGNYPVLLLIDEFSFIARQFKLGGEWKEVMNDLLKLIEDYATRGRKRGRRVIVFGQYTQASRSGGTEVRDSMTQVVFKLKKRRARLVLDQEEAEIVTKLRQGEILVIPARASAEFYKMQLVYPDASGLKMEVDRRLRMEEEGGFQFLPAPEEEEEEQKPLALSFEAKKMRVRDLRKHLNQTELITTVWGASKGGGAAYKRALEEYRDILARLDSEQQSQALS